MDASYILISAFIAGTAKGAAQVGEKIVNDAYSALRGLVIATYGKASQLVQAMTTFEANPASAGRKLTLEEELRAVDAHKNQRLIESADAVLRKAEEVYPKLVGVEWETIKAIRAKFGNVNVTEGVGVSIVHADVDTIEFGDINVGRRNPEK